MGHRERKKEIKEEETKRTGVERERKGKEELMMNYSNGTELFLEVVIEVRDHRER